MATPVQAKAKKMQRIADATYSETFRKFMQEPSQPDFIISVPQSNESPEATHDRRVRQTARALQELGIAFRQDVLPFQGNGSRQFPVHFDDDPSGWSFQVHTTLAIGGLVRLGRQNLEYPLSGSYAVGEAQQRLRDVGWPAYVDPDIIDNGILWQDLLTPGDTAVFRVGNARSPELPPGSWHEFTAPDSTRRIAVAHFAVNPLVLR